MKPLFIPLKTKYFEQFRSGHKRYELRRYGPRWNASTCRVGRKVVLSKGYGKYARLNGKITHLSIRKGWMFLPKDQTAIMECFGSLEVELAMIWISIEGTE